MASLTGLQGITVGRCARYLSPQRPAAQRASSGSAREQSPHLPGGLRLGYRSFYLAKIPFRTRPSWPKKLVVPVGLDVKLNPRALVADQLIVTGLMNSRPAEPGGPVTGIPRVAGPSQRMSKDTVARTEAGFWTRNRAFGMLKKSLTCRFAALIRALPSSRSTVTPPPWPSSSPSSSWSDLSGTVQNRPRG